MKSKDVTPITLLKCFDRSLLDNMSAARKKGMTSKLIKNMMQQIQDAISLAGMFGILYRIPYCQLP